MPRMTDRMGTSLGHDPRRGTVVGSLLFDMHARVRTRTSVRECTLGLLGAIGLMVTLAGTVQPTPAHATQDGKPAIALLGQSFALRAGESFELQLDVTGVDPSQPPTITVTLHEKVRTRTRFIRTLDGSYGRALRTIPRPLAELGAPAGGRILLTIPAIPVGQPDTPDAFPALEPGVYPVSVTLGATDNPEGVARLVTHLVRIPDDAGAPPLRVALVQPFGSPPALDPTGASRLDRPARANLEAIARVLEQSSPVPLSLTPTPETLDALATSGDSVPLATAGALDGRQLVAGPYVGLDLSSFDTSDSLERLLAQRSEGLATLDRRLGRRVGVRTWVIDGPINERGLAHLIDLGIDRVVVMEESMTPLPTSLTLARPFALQDAQGRRTLGASIDKALGEHLGTHGDPVLAANHLLAELAVVYFESPGTQRGVVLRSPAGAMTDPEALDVFLAALEGNPVILKPVTLDGYFADVEPVTGPKGAPVVRRFTSGTTRPPREPDTVAARLHHDLQAMATSVGSADPELDLAKRLSLVADASGVSATERHGYLAGALDLIEGIAHRIRLVDRGTYRLTDREGTVPVTLTNTYPGRPVKVRLHLESDKLEFIGGTANTPGEFTKTIVLNKANTTEEIPVRYRTPGAFPLDITVTTPDRELVLVEARFEIRSTEISGVGVTLSLGAGAFLLLWWARHWRSARRAHRLVAVPAGDIRDHPESEA